MELFAEDANENIVRCSEGDEYGDIRDNYWDN